MTKYTVALNPTMHSGMLVVYVEADFVKAESGSLCILKKVEPVESNRYKDWELVRLFAPNTWLSVFPTNA